MKITYNVVQLFDESVRTEYDDSRIFTRSVIVKSTDSFDAAEKFVCDVCLAVETIQNLNKQLNILYHESYKKKNKLELETIDEKSVELQKEIEQLVEDFCCNFFYISSQYSFDLLNFEIRKQYSPNTKY